jgi:hypothetical protein
MAGSNRRHVEGRAFSRRALLRGTVGVATGLALPGSLTGRWQALRRNAATSLRDAARRPLVVNRAAESGAAGSTMTMYHYDVYRTGWRLAPLTVDGFHRQGTLNLGSAVRAEPLLLEGWQPANGPLAGQTADLLFVCTSGNTLYCFDAQGLLAGNQQPIWKVPLGSATNRTGGYLFPEAGIQGTPVIDTQRREMYVVALLNDGTGTFEEPHATYYFYIVDVDTGTIKNAVAFYDTGGPDRPAFDGNAHNERCALTLSAGRVWVAFSDFLESDAGEYYGWVVGVSVDNPSDQVYWPVIKHEVGGGIWGQGGVIVRSDGTLYVSTGNRPEDYPDYWAMLGANRHPPDIGDYFNAVVRLQYRPDARDLTVLDWFMPTNMRELSAQDYDLSAGTPLLLENVGGRNLVIHCAKDGIVRLLDADRLGGWGGALASYPVFTGGPYGGSRGMPAHMRAPDGTDWVFIAGIGDPGVVAYTVQGGARPALTERWRTSGSEIVLGNTHGSPIITGPAGGATIWLMNSDSDPANGDDRGVPVLYGIDATTGRVVYSSAQNPADGFTKVPHFAVTTPYANVLFVGTWDGLAWYGA